MAQRLPPGKRAAETVHRKFGYSSGDRSRALTFGFWGSGSQKLAGGYTQRQSELLDNSDCWIAFASFNVAYISPMDPGAFGIIFLRPAFARAQVTDVSTKLFPDIHIDDVPSASMINLQTMSNN